MFRDVNVLQTCASPEGTERRPTSRNITCTGFLASVHVSSARAIESTEQAQMTVVKELALLHYQGLMMCGTPW